MTTVSTHVPAPLRPTVWSALPLTVAFAGAVLVRAAVAGPAGAGSLPAGGLFAAVLAVLALLTRPPARISWRPLAVGAVGAAVLVAPAVATGGPAGPMPVAGYAGWAAATTAVVLAEEAFLRGALFGALERWRGPDVAVVGGAVAFAALHVPLYGWHVVPLDLAVGLLLGALRLLTGGWAAPAVAHLGADLAGWWLV